MAEKLSDLIKQLSKTDPQFLARLEQAASAGLKADKLAIYALFVKDNPNFTYEKFTTILARHENSRIDINWNVENYIYRLVVSRRKKQEPKEKKKKGDNETNGESTSTTTETESGNDQ